MNKEEFLKDLCIETDSKIILLVMDGLGDLPENGKTALETASTPNLDHLAKSGCCGLTDPVFRGITPGSGPAHLSLFGYEPTKYILGRGILEALGIDVHVEKNDLVARGNFATLKDGLIQDRRAGRISTEENRRLCKKLNQSVQKVDSTKISFFTGKEHRFVVKFTAQGLSDQLSDADPQRDNRPQVYPKPLSSKALETADMVQKVMDTVIQVLKDESQANTLLLRGFSKFPSIPSMEDLFKLKPAAIANYPMYKGLAKLVGMNVLEAGSRLPDLFETLKGFYQEYNFFYVHVKKTDSFGEDGDFPSKIEVIEKTDQFVPDLLDLEPDVLVVTSDHSTPCLLKSHSWHPNPFLIFSESAQVDSTEKFSEKECSRGYLGRFRSVYAMPLMLAHAGKLTKFGA
ncbi:MAG: 2,3-bisphosphoglycerate-independent phosphoglycerate mutase [Candidatus Aminicenantes bacterium]|nr:2,3-bisphosphoglycerate-independent phosphoglycerate mutase [Candidatus Aminicenantes bacterium]